MFSNSKESESNSLFKFNFKPIVSKIFFKEVVTINENGMVILRNKRPIANKRNAKKFQEKYLILLWKLN